LRIYKYERKLASIKLVSNRYTLAAATIVAKNSMMQYQCLFDFLTNTVNSIGANEAEFLKLLKKLKGTNVKAMKTHEFELQGDLISIVEKQEHDQYELDIVKSFIALQESLLILKAPTRYFYIKGKRWVANVPIDIAFTIFKIKSILVIKLKLLETNEIKQEFGHATFLCQIEQHCNQPKMVTKTGHGRMAKIKQFNQTGLLGY